MPSSGSSGSWGWNRRRKRPLGYLPDVTITIRSHRVRRGGGDGHADVPPLPAALAFYRRNWPAHARAQGRANHRRGPGLLHPPSVSARGLRQDQSAHRPRCTSSRGRQRRGSGAGRRAITGTISWVSSQAEFTPTPIETRDQRANLVYAIKVRVPNAGGMLKIGMPADLQLATVTASR